VDACRLLSTARLIAEGNRTGGGGSWPPADCGTTPLRLITARRTLLPSSGIPEEVIDQCTAVADRTGAQACAPGSTFRPKPEAAGRPRTAASAPSPSVPCMRAVQITRFGGPEVLDIVDLPEPTPGPGQKLYDVSTAGVNYADTHHRLS
jgi:hypothetical protein